MPKSRERKAERRDERHARPPAHVRLPCWWVALVAIAVVVAGSCVSMDDRLLSGPFVLDDGVAVETNPEIMHIGMNLMKRRVGAEMAYHNYNDPSRPIVSLTFQLNYAFSGLSPSGFRVCNILLHWFNGFLVFAMVDTLYAACGLAVQKDEARLWALLAALLFVVSPMNHSTAVYIFARSDIMGATGSLIFTTLGLRGFLAKERHCFNERTVWMLAVLVCSLFSKQLTVTAPVALGFLHLALFESQLQPSGASFGDFATALGRSLKAHLHWMFVLAGYLGFRQAYFGMVGDLQRHLPVGHSELPWPWWCYQLSQPYALLRYLRTMIVPCGIAIDHHILESEICKADFEFYCCIALGMLVAASVFSLVARSAARGPVESLLLSCFGWWFIHLLPTIFVRTTDVYCERRAYLSSAGVYAALVTALFAMSLAEPPSEAKPRANGKPAATAQDGEGSRVSRSLPATAVVVLLAVFVMVSRQLNPVYYSSESLWREVVRQYPESLRGRNNLGCDLIGRLRAGQECLGCADEARDIFEALIRRDPTDTEAFMNMGNLEQALGSDTNALQWYEKVIHFAPNHASGHFKVATTLHKMKHGSYDKILGHYLKVLELAPTHGDLHNNLALLYVHTGQGKRARRVWAEGIAIHPGNAMLLSNQEVVANAP